jgi:hypothetical protein
MKSNTGIKPLRGFIYFLFVRFFMKKSLKRITAFIPYVLLSAPLFAQNTNLPDNLNTMADTVLAFFQAPFLKVVFAIILSGAAVAYAFNKDNEKIKKNAIAAGVAGAILMSAQAVVTAVLGN